MQKNKNNHIIYDMETHGQPAIEPCDMVTKSTIGHFSWNSTCSFAVVFLVFVMVLFYVIRFTVSVWDSGIRGIYGL